MVPMVVGTAPALAYPSLRVNGERTTFWRRWPWRL